MSVTQRWRAERGIHGASATCLSARPDHPRPPGTARRRDRNVRGAGREIVFPRYNSTLFSFALYVHLEASIYLQLGRFPSLYV